MEQQPIAGSADRKQETMQEVKMLLINGQHSQPSPEQSPEPKHKCGFSDGYLDWDDVGIVTQF